MQYIADQAPQKKLAPANGTITERYRLQSWLNFIGTELHKSQPFFNPASGKGVEGDRRR